MLKFACRDLGMDCDHVITGSTVEEVKKKAMEHVKAVHPDVLKTYSTPAKMAEMEKMLESKIK